MSKLIVSQMEIRGVACYYTALIKENKLLEFRFSPVEKKELLGNIYVGQIDNIVPNIQAGFVNIQKNLPCFIGQKDLEAAIYTTPKKARKPAAGDQLLVQIAREAMKGKPPMVTSNLSFTGKYLALTTGKKGLGLSKKLNAEDSARLRNWIQPYMTEEYGIVVRTNAATAKKQEVLYELEYLAGRCRNILQYGSSRSCFSLLDQAEPFYLTAVRDTYMQGLTEIITDIRELEEKLRIYLRQYQPEDEAMLRFYEDSLLPLGNLYSIPTRFCEACREKVWLKSGGFLVIQQTDAFVSIDVNSGKYTGKKKPEEMYRKINLEAAEEIAHQLRLRELSGIILIDFINMNREEHLDELMHVLAKHLRKDPVAAKVHDLTQLHIMEVTRKKVRRPLWEQLAQLDASAGK